MYLHGLINADFAQKVTTHLYQYLFRCLNCHRLGPWELLQVRSCVLLICPCYSLSICLLSGAIMCSRLILYVPCLRNGMGHFIKSTSLLTSENDIEKLILGCQVWSLTLLLCPLSVQSLKIFAIVTDYHKLLTGLIWLDWAQRSPHCRVLNFNRTYKSFLPTSGDWDVDMFRRTIILSTTYMYVLRLLGYSAYMCAYTHLYFYIYLSIIYRSIICLYQLAMLPISH